MSTSSLPKTEISRLVPGLLFLSTLWLQFCYVLAPSWEGGTYYDYGWIVPPVLVYLAYLRWHDRLPPQSPPERVFLIRILILLAVLCLVPIRIIQHVDMTWRPPLWLHAGALLTITHLTIGLLKGWRRSIFLIPATFLILVAVPLPMAIQNSLVQNLTQIVLELARNVLPVMGYPAIFSGSALIVDGKLLDVTEGCSGIRSFQSCIMAALALGELRRFSIPRRLVLLGLALVIAIIANATRIVVLTRIAYTEGHAAMDKAHDSVGLWTALVTYCLVGVLAWLLSLVVRKKVKTVRRKI